MSTYEKKLHFFLNHGKDELSVTCLQSLLNVYRHLPDNQHIMAFHGYLELGVVEYLEEYELVRIGGRGFSRFTAMKNKDTKYFVFEAREFDAVCNAELTLEEFIRRVRPDVIFHIGTEEERPKWSYYQMTKLSKYIRYSHPQIANEEMQKLREAEKRVIYWDLEPKKLERLWFEGERAGILEIDNWKELALACFGDKVTAYLGDIRLGTVFMDPYDELEADFCGLEPTGLDGALFPEEEDTMVLEPDTFEAFLARKVSLEEFIFVTYYDYNPESQRWYDIKVASDPATTWELIQDGWRLATRVKDIMREEAMEASQEERLIFIKAV